MGKNNMAREFLSSRQNQASQFAESRGVDHWTTFSSGLQKQADDFGNYLNSGKYTTADTEKYRSSANKAVEDLTAEMGRYGKNSSEYKTLDGYRQFYQNSLGAFDRMDVGTKAMDYASDYNTWRPQEDYDLQKQSLQDSISQLEAEMEKIEDKNSADYKELQGWKDWYSAIADDVGRRAEQDSGFENEEDYAAFQRSSDYQHVADVRKTLTEKLKAIEEIDPNLKTAKDVDRAITNLQSDYVNAQMAGDIEQVQTLQNKLDQLIALQKSGDLNNLDAMRKELARLENYGDQIIRSVNYGGYDSSADYQKIIDDLREARAKTEEGSADREKIDAQIRAIAGVNGDGTNENGLYDESTWLGRSLMEKFDVEAARKRVEEIDKELEDRGLAKNQFLAKMSGSFTTLDVDENGDWVATDYSGESDPEVIALRQEKRDLTQKLNSSERLQKRSSIDEAANKIDDEERTRLLEAGQSRLVEGLGGRKGYRREDGATNALKNFEALDDEYGSLIRDEVLMALGAAELGVDIGFTVDEVMDAYEAQINDIAGYKAAQKLNEIDSDFLRWNAQVLGVGLESGLNQFGSGVKQAFTEEYVAPSKAAAKGAYTRQNLSRYGDEDIVGSNLSQILFDATQTTANMLPMIAASALVSTAAGPAGAGLSAAAAGTIGELTGAALMGVSSAGNSYNQAIAEGWDKDDAKAFSIVMGAAEAGMQYLIGGISGLGGVTEEGILNAAKGINNAAVRFATETGVHILSETTEELAQNRLERYLQYDLFGKGDQDWMSWNDDDWYTVIVTALSTGAMEAPGTALNMRQSSQIGLLASGEKSLSESQVKHLQSKKVMARNAQMKLLANDVGKMMQSSDALTYTLPVVGQMMGEDTEAYQLASKMENGKLPSNSRNLGELFSAILSESEDADKTMNAIIGGAVKYNELQAANDAVAAENERLAEVRKNNPGAEVLSKTASALANYGADPVLAVKTASAIDKIRNGVSLSSAEMEEITGDSTEAKAARNYLAQMTGDTNFSASTDASVTTALIEKVVADNREAKAVEAEITKAEVAAAVEQAVDRVEVNRATAGAEGVINELESAKRGVETAKARQKAAEDMTIEDVVERNSRENDRLPEMVGTANAKVIDGLQVENKSLREKIQKLADVKVPSAAQRTELADARRRISENETRIAEIIMPAQERVARETAEAKQKAEAAKKATIPAKENAEVKTDKDVINLPTGGTQTRAEYVADAVSRGVSEAQANEEFDNLAAMMGTQKSAQNETSKATEVPAGKKAPRREKLTGEVSFWNGGEIEGVEYDAVDAAEAEQLLGPTEMAFTRDVLSKLVNVTLVKSRMVDGNYVGANGVFYADGRIYLDVNAGADANIGQRSIILTAAHELTHFIRAYNEGAYEGLRNFVETELSRKGESIDEFIERKQNNYKAATGKDLSRDAAIEEVVADACEMMLTDADQIRRFAEAHPSEATSVFSWLSDFFRKAIDAFKDLIAVHPEAKAMRDRVEDLREMWLNALAEANQSAAKTEMEDIVQNDVNANGDVVATTSDNGQGVFSLRTFDEGGRDALDLFLAKQVKKGDLDQTQADEIRQQMETLYEVCKKYDDGTYAPFSEWSNATVVEIDDKPVFSVVKANGEYKLNLDFSLVCKKRRALDAVFNEMISRGIMNKIVGDKAFLEMGQASIAQINNIIREHGFETACALCFVDSKRFRQAMIADAFVQMYNEQVLSLIDGSKGKRPTFFNYGGDTKLAAQQEGKTGIEGLPDFELNWSKINRILKTEKKGTVAWKIANHLKNNSSARQLVARGDFMSTAGFDALNVHNPELLGLYNSKKGAGGPKAAQSDVQYLNDIINSSSFNAKAAYEVGGVRIQSFSDYVGRLVFDYVQMVGDLAAKELPAHAYTKEFQFAQQFGLTGIKINMSLVPAVVEDGVAPGLDKNGNYVWKDGQSFGSTVYDNNGKRMTAEQGFQLAIQIQDADGYSQNCGTIAVGVSNEHILKMLDDPNIRMIIPYHKSSLNHLVAAMNQIDKYTDYTNVQNTRKKNSQGEWVKLGKSDTDFNWNDTLQRLEREGKGAREAAEEYKRWCAERGYLPKFDEFAYHPNYYKVLEDFTAYDKDGTTPAPLGAVQMKFPQEGSAFGSMEELIKAGLDEDAMLQAKQEKGVTEIVDEIEATLPTWEAQLREQGEQFAIGSGRQSLERTQMRDAEQTAIEAGMTGESQKSGAMFSARETNPATLKWLDDQVKQGDYVTAYKTFLELPNEDGTVSLYPPMASKQTDENGKRKMANAMAVGEWEKSVGNPDSKNIIEKNGKWYYRLVKDNGKTVDAAYDPYQHSSNVVLNDQFEEAYQRPNLVTYEVIIPKSELSAGERYSATRADGRVVEAALPVGEHPWKKGTVAGKLKNTDRTVYMTRWLLPNRRLDNSEVAQMYKDILSKEENPVAVPFNVVPPGLLSELEKIGVPIDYAGSPMYKAHQQRKAEREGGAKYSIRGLPDGRKYVKLDGNIFLNEDGTEMTPKEAYETLIGKPILTENGETITFERGLPGVNLYKEAFKRYPYTDLGENFDRKPLNDKINQNYPDIVRLSESENPHAVQNHEHKGVEDFDERKVLIADDNAAYELKLAVANTEDGRKVVYAKQYVSAKPDVLEEIKKTEARGKSPENQSMDTIAQNNPEVNRESESGKLSSRDVDSLYPEGTLENDLLRLANNPEELSAWVNEQMAKHDDALGNAKISAPAIPSKGFAPRVSEKERNALNKTLDTLIDRYGAQKPSEKSNGFVIPAKNQKGQNLRRGLQNVGSAKNLPQDAQDQVLRFTLTNAAATYVPDSNEKLIKNAKAEISDMGLDHSLTTFKHNAAKVDLGTKGILQNIALGEQLLIETAANGDMANFIDVLSSVCELGTTVGKSLQAFRLLKQSGPIGELYYVQKAVDRLNKQNEERMKHGKFTPIVAKDDLAKAVINARTEEERNKAMDALIADIASQAPVTIRDRWNAWRYLAMLGNARTHIRNVIGNAVFVPLRYTKDVLANAGEFLATKAGLIEEEDRTKALTVSRDLRDFALSDADVFKKELQGNGKYNPAQEILQARKLLPGFLNTLSKKNGDFLEAEDWIFLKAAYARALGQQLSHSGYSIEELQTTVEGQKALNRARKAAIEEAQKATYRDFVAVASWLNRGKQLKGAAGTIVSIGLEGVLPFTKTPINILRRGVEYSPIGIAKGIGQIISGIQNGNLDVAEAIDSLAAGLTGTGVAALGWLLARMGVLRGKKSDDDEENFDKLQGDQDYSIRIGNQSFTIDWAAPTALPLFTGAAVAQLMDDSGGELELKDAWNAIMMIAEPMTSLSMLDGLNKLIESTAYASGNEKIATIATQAATSYLGQAFPTILGQVARSIDGTRRSTYVDKNSPIPAAAQRFVQSSVQNKIPGWESKKTPYIDAWGRTSEPSSKVLNGIENFFAPWYRSVKQTTDVDEAINDLYKRTKADILPSTPSRYFSVNGERRDLTADEYVSFATDVGQTKYELMTQLISDPRYLALDDTQKAKVIKEYIYKYATAAGKYHVDSNFDIHGSGIWIEEAEAATTPYARFERIWQAIEKGLKL